MRVIKTSSYQEMSQRAAIVIAAQIVKNPTSVMGFATGSTPEGLYEELIKMGKDGAVDFSGITTFNLDEYYGLKGDHPQSYRYFMQEKLFQHININQENIHMPDGSTSDPAAECKNYEAAIESAGGVDLQLLGIGGNGHIGFNEPSDAFSTATKLVDLTEETLNANQRFFESREEVPKQAISMGINTIMKAKSILLIASGKDKQEAVEKMINGPVTPQVPASILQYHPDVTVIYCD